MTSMARRLSAFALSVILAASCSTSSPRTANGTTDGSTSNRAQGFKFAACMRANGVKDFPDPDASGQLTIDAIANGTSLDTNSAAFKQALGACKSLQPAGFTGEKRTADQQAAALRFAQCVRDNGVKDFPDPTAESPLIDTNHIPSAGSGAGMSILHAAMKQCGTFAKEAGVTGP